jgi:hypothetical protein
MLRLSSVPHAPGYGIVQGRGKCVCPACVSYSRAYLHHLCRYGEILASMLLTWHNLRYHGDLMKDLRAGDRRAACEVVKELKSSSRHVLRLRSGRGEMFIDHRCQRKAHLILSVVEGSGPNLGSGPLLSHVPTIYGAA